jgi:hypothetical protein
MCFFDPLHGPSVTEVLWTRPGHGSRRAPACSTDADRVTNNLLPEVLTVKVGTRRMPYWAAGRAFLSYAEGYFASVAAFSWALHPAAFEAAPETGRYFPNGIGGGWSRGVGGGGNGTGGGGGGADGGGGGGGGGGS